MELPSSLSVGNYSIVGELIDEVANKPFDDIARNNLAMSLSSLELAARTLIVNTNGEGSVNRDNTSLIYANGARISLTANSGKGASFTGWGGDAIGALSQITILMDSDKTVQANFSSRANLQVHVRGAGKVTGMADLGSYAVNDTASVTAEPAEGWVFSAWSGAATGSSVNSSIIMNTNKVVTATFIKPKTTWKSENFTEAELLDNSISGDDSDPDGDGLKNWQEYLHLSNPKDPASKGIIDLKVGGGFLYTIFTRNSGAEGNMSLVCQGSRNMMGWDAPDIQERILSTNNGVETVEARIPANGKQQGFLRLKYQK